MTKYEEVRERIARVVRHAYISGYNARCNGEVWEQCDGSVKLPERLILIDTYQILSDPDILIRANMEDRGKKVATFVEPKPQEKK